MYQTSEGDALSPTQTLLTCIALAIAVVVARYIGSSQVDAIVRLVARLPASPSWIEGSTLSVTRGGTGGDCGGTGRETPSRISTKYESQQYTRNPSRNVYKILPQPTISLPQVLSEIYSVPCGEATHLRSSSILASHTLRLAISVGTSSSTITP